MTEEDIPVLVAMGKQAHAESEYRIMEYSSERCTELGKYILINPEIALCLVAVLNDVIIGFLMAECCQTYFSDEKTASDLLVYVSPEHRGTRASYMLVKEYILWAKAKLARIVFLRQSTGYKPDEVAKLYQRLGFEKVGGIYSMEVS